MPSKDFNSSDGFQVIDDVGIPPKQYGTGRRCDFRGCNAVLSRYNPGSFCYPHEKKRILEELRITD